jgi:hypothetical protein
MGRRDMMNVCLQYDVKMHTHTHSDPKNEIHCVELGLTISRPISFNLFIPYIYAIMCIKSQI